MNIDRRAIGCGYFIRALVPGPDADAAVRDLENAKQADAGASGKGDRCSGGSFVRFRM